MSTERTRTFRDLDLNFTRHPITGDVAMKTGDAAIIQSLKNLVYTNFYENPFHPEIGSSVRQFLFENVTGSTAIFLRRAIRDVIRNFEPRVRIRDVVVQARPDKNYFEVNIVVYIINQTEPVSVRVFLRRVR